MSERTTKDRGEVARELESLAKWMDSVFEVPILKLKFGLDALLGLLPGAGDVASSATAIYILNAAQRFGVAKVTLLRMTLNIVIDVLLGSLPLVGDLFDVYWKSNQRNVALLRRHMAANPEAGRELKKSDAWFVGMLIGVICILTIASIVAAFFIAGWVIRSLAR
jgi:hypothetical protein